jgi:hypothetical protein
MTDAHHPTSSGLNFNDHPQRFKPGTPAFRAEEQPAPAGATVEGSKRVPLTRYQKSMLENMTVEGGRDTQPFCVAEKVNFDKLKTYSKEQGVRRDNDY